MISFQRSLLAINTAISQPAFPVKRKAFAPFTQIHSIHSYYFAFIQVLKMHTVSVHFDLIRFKTIFSFHHQISQYIDKTHRLFIYIQVLLGEKFSQILIRLHIHSIIYMLLHCIYIKILTVRQKTKTPNYFFLKNIYFEKWLIWKSWGI